ncbi:TetR/AcrR family transcriptional regulator [Arthrobacter sp. 260]|uniref:TetR/AcrR family transcriptional regulator n=1 Tax=Arthrobacter sp. 260 TaxID=2735314 RepID=UPI001492A3E3|nr:TetR/AcrR family transcriptional regulator [Arthrobacter sp. 260]NOJ61184.1 TetR family transcriptional regulator [Arthrobacter sp. 260]
MIVPKEPGPRQRKQAATALTIERSAVALVLEHGLEAVTVDMICAASHVSQRTFFNYYGTKDAAILGTVPVSLNEQKVREFLASDSPDLLGDLLDLLAALLPGEGTDLELVASRMKIIAQTSSLMHKEMERLSAIHDDVCSILYLRLRRHAQPGETEDAIRQQCTLIAHLIPGLVRFTFEQPHNGATPSEAGPTSLLTAALKKLIPPDQRAD